MVAGRYRVSSHIGRSAYGAIYKAHDTLLGADVAIRRVRPDLIPDINTRENLAAEVARACSLEHPNIVKPIDFVVDDEGVAVVSQLVEGKTLRVLTALRGGRFTVRDVAGIVGQLCAALSYAAGMTHHGGINASNIIVGDNGHVRLAEFGLARALPPRAHLLDPPDRASLAPELPRSDSRTDLYALGTILFELLTGKPHVPGLLPRNVKPALPVDIDAVASCLLSPIPEERFADAETLRQALARVVENTPPPAPKSSAAPPQQAAPSEPAKKKKKKVHVDHHEARWLVHKGKLDYGPYTLAELKDKIEKDEVVPGDIVIDQELGTRAEAEAHPLLHDIVLSAAQRRDDARRAHVEATVVRHDKHRGLALYGFIGVGALVIVGGGLLGFRYLRAGGAAERHKAAADVAAADLGGLKLGSARRVDDRDAQRRHRTTGTRRAAAGTAAAPADGFDEALAFDMADPAVGDERLDDSQINGVLVRHSASLGRCLQAEASRGGARSADIDFIVLGTGKVSQVRVNGQTGTALASCVRAAMAGMSFPTFNGPRTKASFPMSL